MRKNEPPAAVGEIGRQETVFRQKPADPRKGRKAGLGRIGEDNEDTGQGDVVEHAPPRHGRNQLREDGLITRLGLIHCPDVVSGTEMADAQQEQGEDHHNYRQGSLGIANGGLAEERHGVADGLDAGQSRTAVGEGGQKYPGAQGFSYWGKFRRRHDGVGVAAALPDAEQPDNNGDCHTHNKYDHRDDEGLARFANAAQIEKS